MIDLIRKTRPNTQIPCPTRGRCPPMDGGPTELHRYLHQPPRANDFCMYLEAESEETPIFHVICKTWFAHKRSIIEPQTNALS